MHPQNPTQALRTYLLKTTPGSIDDTTELERLLAECWDEFHGSSEEQGGGYKLLAVCSLF
jgi:hypothetical protein